MINYTTDDYGMHLKNVVNMKEAKCAVQCSFVHEFEDACEEVENAMFTELRHRSANIEWQKEQMRKEV